MNKINVALISFSSMLLAQSASAQWSVVGFVGKSNARSLIDCSGGQFPTTTLTTSSIDTPLLNQAAIDAALAGTPQSDFINSDFSAELLSDFQVIVDSGTGNLLTFDVVFPEPTNVQELTTSTTFVGSPDDLGLTTVSTQFIPTTPIAFVPVNLGNIGGFDVTSLEDFLSGGTSNGVAADFLDFFNSGADFIPATATSEGALVS